MKKQPIKAVSIELHGTLRVLLSVSDFLEVVEQKELSVFHVHARKGGFLSHPKPHYYLAPTSEVVFWTYSYDELEGLNIDFEVSSYKFTKFAGHFTQ